MVHVPLFWVARARDAARHLQATTGAEGRLSSVTARRRTRHSPEGGGRPFGLSANKPPDR